MQRQIINYGLHCCAAGKKESYLLIGADQISLCGVKRHVQLPASPRTVSTTRPNTCRPQIQHVPAEGLRLGVKMPPQPPGFAGRYLHICHCSSSQSSLPSKLQPGQEQGEQSCPGRGVGHQGCDSILLPFHLEVPPSSPSQINQPHRKAVSTQNVGRSRASVPHG